MRQCSARDTRDVRLITIIKSESLKIVIEFRAPSVSNEKENEKKSMPQRGKHEMKRNYFENSDWIRHWQ